jgi:ACT domain-containing protein
MSLSDFEIEKITEIVAGKIGEKLDAKTLRQVVDRVVDGLKEKPAYPEITGITGVTCEVSKPKPEDLAVQLTPDNDLQSNIDSQQNNKGGLYEEIEKTVATRIIVAAFGKERPGVVAAITAVLAENNCSIQDISQTIMQEFFSMIMVVDISGCPLDFSALRDSIQATETQLGMKVYVMHEDIFRYMHRI